MADTSTAPAQLDTDTDIGTKIDTAVDASPEVALVDDVLVEEVSIDGMCGVY